MAKKSLAEIVSTEPPPPPPKDKLEAIHYAAVKARDLELEIIDLSASLDAKKADLRTLYETTIPDMMDEIGIDKIGIPQIENYPAFDLKIETEFGATIAASWDDARRQAALDWMTEHGHGDLIKTELKVNFSKGDYKKAVALAAMIEAEYGTEADVKETIHASTLKSWFKEAWQKKLTLPPLDLIGGYVKRIAKPKGRK